MDYYNKEIIKDINLLGQQSSFFGSPLIDRTNTYDQGLKILTPLVFRSTDLTFEQIMDQRAVELLEMATKNNRDIKVSYSGGIDSTAVLVGLLKHKDDYPDVNIITVMSEESYVEYPEFYENHLKRKTTVCFVDALEVIKTLCQTREKKYYIVTGEIGDQLFGSMKMFECKNPEMLSRAFATELKSFHYQKLKPLAMKNPFYNEDKSYACFLWWLNFTLKYQWVQVRMLVRLGREHAQNLIHYYDTDDFQAWALSTPMKEKFTDFSKPYTYKMPAKKYIFDYANDLWYFVSKQKVPSLYNTVEKKFTTDLSRISEDFRIYNIREEEYEVV